MKSTLARKKQIKRTLANHRRFMARYDVKHPKKVPPKRTYTMRSGAPKPVVVQAKPRRTLREFLESIIFKGPRK